MAEEWEMDNWKSTEWPQQSQTGATQRRQSERDFISEMMMMRMMTEQHWGWAQRCCPAKNELELLCFTLYLDSIDIVSR